MNPTGVWGNSGNQTGFSENSQWQVEGEHSYNYSMTEQVSFPQVSKGRQKKGTE